MGYHLWKKRPLTGIIRGGCLPAERVLDTTTSRVPVVPAIWTRCAESACILLLNPHWYSIDVQYRMRAIPSREEPGSILTQGFAGPGLLPATCCQQSRTVTPCGFYRIIQMQHDVTLKQELLTFVNNRPTHTQMGIMQNPVQNNTVFI